MTAVVVVLLLAAVAAVAVAAAQRARARRERERVAALEAVTRVADEDVTRFGEELQDLHVETLTTDLDVAMRQDYQRALDSYEAAKDLLRDVARPEDVKAVTRSLEDGRYAMACVLARQAGDPLPQRLAPCFFNAAHGPSSEEVEWAPPGGVARDVPVCRDDAERLAAGAEPDTRMVRDGSRMVPWYDGGAAYRPYADGYYGVAAMNGLFPVLVLSMMASDASAFDTYGGADGAGGGWDMGGSDDGGGFGGGGFDGGGFDGGGGGF
ncbi:hypothetical protein INN71_02070 [Nocardioides sp. ChNu-153]|uniref:hypothetical protein n=1 Tax=unclassified Nocardioides TaxID=2615069 RepID=UPI002407069D|nr:MULTISPECIES: hypothetical protein [unclassified Nocardioides]MDF9714701.1 hypothetical protein [Nocardioides sp. ChNu-99]MDN7120170.1 hypothetical protein [Nocardioides sp. ChNu-153]